MSPILHFLFDFDFVSVNFGNSVHSPYDLYCFYSLILIIFSAILHMRRMEPTSESDSTRGRNLLQRRLRRHHWRLPHLLNGRLLAIRVCHLSALRLMKSTRYTLRFKYTFIGTFWHGRHNMKQLANYMERIGFKTTQKLGLLDDQHILLTLVIQRIISVAFYVDHGQSMATLCA